MGSRLGGSQATGREYGMTQADLIVTPSDEEAYTDFAKRYGQATSDYQLACVLSGRLRDLDKRSKAANRRADACADLIRASSALIEELKAFGYGQTSEKALPGSYDALMAELERIKE